MPEPSLSYWIASTTKEMVFETDDWDKAWKTLKKYPAGYKIIRRSDNATLAFNAGYKNQNNPSSDPRR